MLISDSETQHTVSEELKVHINLSITKFKCLLHEIHQNK